MVDAWIVVMRPSLMPNASFTACASGARQLVVHDAFDTNFMSGVYFSRFTPQTNVGVSSFAGPDITTTCAPPSRCPCAFSFVMNWPVHSIT